MVGVVDLSQETVSAVLDDFVGTIKQQTNLGLGTTDYVESVLKRALGEDKASTVLSRILPGGSTKGLEILRWMDARAISDMIINEHPQVIAIILSVLEYDVAADVLSFLPPENRGEVMQRVARLETVQPSAMDELERIMAAQFSSNSSAQSSSFGGVKTAAKIMNFVKVDMETSVMQALTSLDEELTLQIQDNMFTFENLSMVDNRAIQVMMRNIESDLLMVALKGASEETRDKFFDNMSQRAKAMFIDDMESKGPMRISDVEDAQKNIMRIARKLSDAGELVLSEASLAGDLSERSLGFEATQWHKLGDESDDDAESFVDGVASPEASDEPLEGEVEDAPSAEAPVDMETLLEARYQEGVAEGIRQSNLENQQREALAERIEAVIQREMAALPRVWPVVTDLSLDIAKTVCLRALQTDESFFRDYLRRALQQAELPEDLPVEIKVSAAMAEWVPAERLAEMFPDQPVTLSIDPALADGDIAIHYDHIAIERLLEGEFAQLREQLVAQFPERPIEP
jgi:flagellar motor switch protein FliG